MRPPGNRAAILLVALPLAFLGVFYFYPLFEIFSLSLAPGGQWDPGNITALFSTGSSLRILWFTTWQAALSTVLTVVLALPAAYVFARYRFPGKSLIQSCTTIPFVLPSVVVAAAFSALLGDRGLANEWLMVIWGFSSPPIRLEQSLAFILMAHVFYNFTVVLRIVGGFWSRIHPGLSHAAQVLGASPWQAFWKVTFPVLRPGIMAASLLVFIFCFSSFGVILILGGPRYSTIEVAIYRQAVHLFNLPMAAALSLLQICFMFAFMWVYTRLQRSASVPFAPESLKTTQRDIVTNRDRVVVWGTVFLMLLFLASPLLALVVCSLSTGSGVSLLYYRAIFQNAGQSIFYIPPALAIGYSVWFALVTLVLSLCIGLPVAIFLSRDRGLATSLLDPLFMLPLATSAVTLGFGYIVALDEPPLNLRASLIIVPLAHTLVAYPFVVRSILPGLRSIPEHIRESAVLLGAAPGKVWWKVVAPMVRKSLAVGAIFAFTVSIGEFGATVFLARPEIPTVPLAIYRFLGQPGAMNYGQAMAMSTILMLVTAAGFLFLEKLRTGPGGEF
ncbi:MAG TPA: iron ABC transporter permease [Deltaproteobacteria bacterium]|nr:iron ABC transporter permease [Deltaproteobacteria bacterium]